MTSPINPAQNSGQGAQVPIVNNTARVGPDAITAGAIAQTHGGEVTSKTMIGSIEDLKKKAPEVYKKMMEGIAMNIVGEMRHHQERLKKLMRESTDGR